MGNFLSEFLLDVGLKAIRASQAAEKISQSDRSKKSKQTKRSQWLKNLEKPKPKTKTKPKPKKQPEPKPEPEQPRTLMEALSSVDFNNPEEVRAVFGDDATVEQIGENNVRVFLSIDASYDPEKQQYTYMGDVYQDGDIIWNDMPEGVGYLANIYPERVPSLNLVSVRYLDTKNPRINIEFDYIRVHREAKERDCPTYAIVCRNGRFNLFVYDFCDDHCEPFYALKLFNLIPCSPESPRLYASVTLEVDNKNVDMISVRREKGRSIDWDKEVKLFRKEIQDSYEQEMELYQMGVGDDPNADPYAILDDPPEYQAELPPELLPKKPPKDTQDASE